MLKNKAFTLTEILLALGILGIITGAVAMQLQKMEADSIKIAFQNCYSQLVSIITEMANDETVYPKIPTSTKDADGKTQYLIFANDYLNGTSFDANQRFISEFEKRLANDGEESIENPDQYRKIIKAKNNSSWYIYTGILNTTNGVSAYAFVYIDVNGRNKGPNCPFDLNDSNFIDATFSNGTNCTKPDTFAFTIYQDGRIKFRDFGGGVYNGSYMETYLKNNHYLDSNRTD